LEQLIERCGPDRPACVAREISKFYEDLRTAPLKDLLAHYADESKAKGEIVIIVAGAPD
jgi:16S rRNA (cytidine1402-2'-O)-methyltransferase